MRNYKSDIESLSVVIHPLEEDKEGQLKGGFAVITSVFMNAMGGNNGNCGGNCRCSNTSNCICENPSDCGCVNPSNCATNCDCSNSTNCDCSSTGTSAPTNANLALFVM